MNEPDRSPDSRTSGALWVAAGLSVPGDIDGRLRTGAVALEIGCGGGLGCLALAEAYPATKVVGHDRDAEAIARAQAMAHAADLDGRVSFVVSDSERLPRNGYDLVTVATLSDRRHALEVLNAIRNAIVPDGVCVLLEPPVSVVLGGPKRRRAEDRLRALAERAGFSKVSLVCRGSTDIYELRR
jgi:predicted O-methyltransferase YrrM